MGKPETNNVTEYLVGMAPAHVTILTVNHSGHMTTNLSHPSGHSEPNGKGLFGEGLREKKIF